MIKRLITLNGLAILGVLLNHAIVWAFVAMIYWTHRYLPVSVPNFDQVGSPTYFILKLLKTSLYYSIPSFLFISGLFIAVATGQKSNIEWKVLFNRVKYLVIPYIIWSVLILIGMFLEGKTFGLYEYVRLIVTGQVKGPYYFVPLLIQYYLISPILVPIAKFNWKLLLIGAIIIQLFISVWHYSYLYGITIPFIPDDFIPIVLFPTRIFWYVLGLVVGFQLHNFKLWLPRVKWIALTLTIVFLLVGFYEGEQFENELIIGTFINGLYALGFIFTFLAFENIHIPFSDKIAKLGYLSFGLYLVHVPAQQYISRIIYHIAPWMLGHQILFTLVIFIAGLGIPLALMEIVKKSPVKNYYKYLFG